MPLSKFIVDNVDTILAHWVAHVRELSCAADMHLSELQDHGRLIVLTIAADMKTLQSDLEQQQKSHGQSLAQFSAELTYSEQHGRDRKRAGFTNAEIVGEYRALRASVTQLWMASARTASLSTVYAWTRFHEAVDQQIMEALLQDEDSSSRTVNASTSTRQAALL